MTISVTGSVESIGINAFFGGESGSVGITVPTDTLASVLAFGQGDQGSAGTPGLSSATIGSAGATILHNVYDTDANLGAGLAVVFAPTTGSTNFNYTFATEQFEGTPVNIVHLTSDTASSLALPTGTPSGLAQTEFDVSEFTVNLSYSTATNPFGLIFVTGYTPFGENPNAAPSGSGQTVIVNNTPTTNNISMDVATEDSVGATSMAGSGESQLGWVLAVVLHEVGGGGGGGARVPSVRRDHPRLNTLLRMSDFRRRSGSRIYTSPGLAA